MRAASEGHDRNWPWFRAVVCLALVATVWITWPLWSVRDTPPLLPWLDLPQLPLGLPLIAAALATLVIPVPGAIVVSALVAYGMVTDQTRMQPELFSLPILLWGSLPSPSARLIARAHLLTLWFFAGVHKLASPDFISDTAASLAAALPFSVPQFLLGLGAGLVATVEIGTALLALWPQSRRLAAWCALILHGGIVLSLALPGEWRNVAVWPWNIALAGSGFALIAPWTTILQVAWRAVPLLPRIVALAMMAMPIGFYAGIVDAYPAHQLYSSGVASATVYCPAGCRPEQDVNATWYALKVPLPPEPRLFYASFAKSCAPGDTLRIDPPRSPLWMGNGQPSLAFCPVGSLPASHP